MNGHSEMVCAGGCRSRPTSTATGPAVVVIPSYRRDGGEDFEPFTAAVVIGSLMGAALAAALVCLQRGDTTEQLKSAVQQAMGIAVTGLRNVRSAVSPDQE